MLHYKSSITHIYRKCNKKVQKSSVQSNSMKRRCNENERNEMEETKNGQELHSISRPDR